MLRVTLDNPGTTVTLFDIFKFIQHVAADRERYGIVNDISISCASVPKCNEDRASEGGKYFTEDGLHPSEKTSEIIANAYKYYLRDPRQPLMSRVSDGSLSSDPYFDAFADVVVTKEASELTHNVVGGVLDLSLKSQVDSLTPKVVLNGALLRFDDAVEKNQDSQYSHQLSANILIKERFAGIEIANMSSEFIYRGNASGSALLKSGLGTLVLTGKNSFDGGRAGGFGVAVVGGVLQVGNAGDTGSLSSDVIINEKSSLAFNHSMDHSFAGNVVGTGALLKKGTGVLTLTGDNAHSGGTTISAGTLQIGDGSDKGWLQGNVVNDAVMVFNRGDNQQFDGRIDGSGSIVKIGTGSVNLTGSGGVTGRTEVRRGKLGFNGIFDATDVQVSHGAVVYGGGTVRSLSLEAGGAIAPGNSIGTFNVINDIVFNKGSVYAIDANAAGLSDMIKAGGVADIKGGDVLVDAESGQYSPTSQYTVLSTRGGVNGQFDSVSANFAFLDPSLSYGMSDVSLLLVRNDVKPIDLCQGVNEKAVCAELLPVVPEPGTTVTSVIPVVEPVVAATPVIPVVEPLVAVGERNDLFERENAVVIGMSKSEFTRFASLLPGDIHPTVKTVLAQESSYIRDSISKRLYETEKGWSDSGAWGYVFGSEGRQKGARSISGLSRNTQGFILGSDVWVEDADLSLGVIGGYRKTSMSQRASSADIGTYNLGIYGSKRYEALSVRLGASFSWHDIETKRKVNYKGRVSTPDSDYHGNTVQLFSELAYDLKFDRFGVEPFVGFSYSRLDISRFSEEKDLFSLSGKRDVKDIYASTLGARVNYSIQYNDDIKASFQAGAGLKHTFSDISSNTNMALHSRGDDFRISGLPLKKNIAQLNAKVAVQTNGGFSVGLDYMAEKASGMRDQSISAFASLEF
ncbi:hypothetical protein BLX41_04750 [Pseudomonas protegens]|nr:hypothetical protein BLX41_04750 [Pseudomonas protegens]